MKALIDPRFNRVCEKHETGFPVAEPLFWVDCDESVNPDQDYWDGSQIVVVPVVVEQVTKVNDIGQTIGDF